MLGQTDKKREDIHRVMLEEIVDSGFIMNIQTPGQDRKHLED
jgi:hypothetical protein